MCDNPIPFTITAPRADSKSKTVEFNLTLPSDDVLKINIPFVMLKVSETLKTKDNDYLLKDEGNSATLETTTTSTTILSPFETSLITTSNRRHTIKIFFSGWCYRVISVHGNSMLEEISLRELQELVHYINWIEEPDFQRMLQCCRETQVSNFLEDEFMEEWDLFPDFNFKFKTRIMDTIKRYS
uniref:Uncharacterized protein n=1 Tax=Glossina austeni TaxID=7395 RepID=A0A1A9UNS5_GLOAU